jgi:hypothetical protein
MRKYTRIKQYGAQMEEMKRAGKTNREIGEAFGLEKEQVQDYFKRSRIEQRLRGYPSSRKDDTAKTNQELRREIRSLRMEVELLRDFLGELGRR